MRFFKVGNTSPRLSSKSSEKSCRVFQVFLQSISSLIDWIVIIFETNADIIYLCHTFREAMLVICISCFPLSQVHRWIISSSMVLILVSLKLNILVNLNILLNLKDLFLHLYLLE